MFVAAHNTFYKHKENDYAERDTTRGASMNLVDAPNPNVIDFMHANAFEKAYIRPYFLFDLVVN